MQRKSDDKFQLIQICDNLVDKTSASKMIPIVNGHKKVQSVLSMFIIQHKTSKYVLELVKTKKISKYIEFVSDSKYPLPVTYDKTSKKVLVNVGFFHASDITSSKPTDRQLYSSLTYGLIFYQMVNQKSKLSIDIAHGLTNYYTSMFVSLFGKQYGLIGIYTNKIPKLKFLIGCYVLARYFEMEGVKMYREAQSMCGADYIQYEEKLSKYDFSNIRDFVKSLDELDVFPSFQIYKFMSRLYSSFGLSFLAAFEDINRLIPSIIICNIGGNDIIPAFLYKYNIRAFNALLSLNDIIFRGM